MSRRLGPIIRTSNIKTARNIIIVDLILRCSVLFLIPNMLCYYGDVFYSYVVIPVPVACTDHVPPPPVRLNRTNAGHGLLMLEVSRSHTATHHSR